MLEKELMYYILADYNDRGNSILYGFFQLALYVLSEKKHYTISPPILVDDLKEVTGMEIEIAVAKEILDEMVQEDILYYSTYNGVSTYELKNGFNSTEFLKRKEDFNLALNSISTSLTTYANFEFNEKWTIEESREKLLNFVKYKLDILILSDIEKLNNEIDSKDTHTDEIIKLFIVSNYEKKEKGLIDYLNKITQGVVCYQFIYYKNDAKDNLDNLHIFIDAPIALHALGHTGEIREKFAIQLINQLGKTEAKLRIFPHTIQEMINSLLACRHKVRYREVGYGEGRFTVEHFLRKENSVTKIDDAIDSLKIDMEKLGIFECEHDFYSDQDFNKNYSEPDFLELLKKEMHSDIHREESIFADYKSIILTRLLRNNKKSQELKDAKAIFITTSKRLAYLSSKFFDERKPYIPSVIPNSQLSTKLLLQDGLCEPDIPLNLIIESCYATIFPSDSTWDKYIARLNKKYDSGEISDYDYAKCRTRNTIQTELRKREIKDMEMTTISLDELIKEQSNKEKEEKEAEIKRKEEEFNLRIDEINLKLQKKEIETQALAKERQIQEQDKKDKVEDLKKEYEIKFNTHKRVIIIIVLLLFIISIILNSLNAFLGFMNIFISVLIGVTLNTPTLFVLIKYLTKYNKVKVSDIIEKIERDYIKKRIDKYVL